MPNYLPETENEFEKNNLKNLSISKGELFSHVALDYFFMTRNHSLNWKTFKNVVIGRVKYDNYFAMTAIAQGVNTVDVTDTCLALHLSKDGSPNTGILNVDRDYNIHAIGRFPAEKGSTRYTQFKTERNLDNIFYIRRNSQC